MYFFESASIKHLPQLLGSSKFHPAVLTAPSLIESFGFVMHSSGSTAVSVPIPEQFGHAPSGLLNEKLLVLISPKEMPQSGHARFCEKNSSDVS